VCSAFFFTSPKLKRRWRREENREKSEAYHLMGALIELENA
jgi:hypothetical protein